MIDVSVLPSPTPGVAGILLSLAAHLSVIGVVLSLGLAAYGTVRLYRGLTEPDPGHRKRLIRASWTPITVGLLLAALMTPVGLYLVPEAEKNHAAAAQSREDFTRAAVDALHSHHGYELLEDPGPVLRRAYEWPADRQEHHLATDVDGNLVEILIVIRDDGRMLVNER